jgi:hypothetical protein
VGFFTPNPTKLGLKFSNFSTIFYGFYKNQQQHFYYFRFAFAAGTLEFLDSYTDALTLRLSPWKEFSPRNVTPRGGGRRGRSKFQRGVAGVRPERAGEWSMGYWGSVCGLGWGEERPVGGHTGGQGWWPPRLPSAASLRPGRATGGRGGFWRASGGGEAIQFRRSYAGVDVRRRASMGSTACSGAPVRRGQGSTFIRETASWHALDHQGGTGPKASACVRDKGGTPRRPAVRRQSVRPVGRGARLGHSARKGRTSRALGTRDASGGAGHGRLGWSGACAGAVRRSAAQDVLVCLRLTAFFPKILNRSAPSDE